VVFHLPSSIIHRVVVVPFSAIITVSGADSRLMAIHSSGSTISSSNIANLKHRLPFLLSSIPGDRVRGIAA
jgi:hypothetical protein